MMKTKYIYYGILVSLIAILMGSVSHLAYTFASLEVKQNDGSYGYVSWILAIGIESGMLAIAFGFTERRRRKEGTTDLLLYLFFFGLINFYANTYYAISTYTDVRNLKMKDVEGLDALIRITIGFLSSSLPLLVIALTELLSIFAVKMKQEEKEQARLQNQQSSGPSVPGRPSAPLNESPRARRRRERREASEVQQYPSSATPIDLSEEQEPVPVRKAPEPQPQVVEAPPVRKPPQDIVDPFERPEEERFRRIPLQPGEPH